MHPRPHIAICTPNTFEAMGLRDIIERMVPQAEACLFTSFHAMVQAGDDFFHYFIDSRTLLAHAPFFIAHQRQTIVLTYGPEQLPLSGFHTLNVYQEEDALVRSILTLAAHGHAHHAHGPHAQVHPAAHGAMPASHGPKPAACPPNMPPHPAAAAPVLTPRETDVLRLLVKGLINKEIADRLGVGLTTVITHRKNLTQKLGMRSVSALTIYAVTRGLVKIEDIEAH